MTTVIIIILIIVLIDKNNQYKKLLQENKKLKEKLQFSSEQAIKNVIPKEQVVEKKEVINKVEQEQAFDQYFNENKKQEINEEKKVKNEKERKNIAILITGAICIVLSAIVFLMSTWNTIPNVLKTVVLSLLTLVFFGGSYIAEKKFKLDKASQTFFYIAMAYIPICLLSIFIFELFGTYLSICGEGKYIYLMVASLFVAFIYYATYMNKNNKYLLFGSLLSQIFSVISLSLIFSNDVLIICISLLLYNILLMLLTKKDIFIKIYNFIPAIITLVVITMLGEQTKTMIFLLMLLATNFLILELKNSRNIYSYMFNIFLMLFGIYTIIVLKNTIGVNLTILFALGYVILIYIIENMLLIGSDKKNLSNSLTVVTLLSIGILHIDSFINTRIISPYFISILQILILTITYIKSKLIGKNITATLIPIYFIITGINIINELECSYHAYIIFALLTFIISEFFRKKDKLIHSNAFAISHIFIALTYITAFMTNFKYLSNDIIYAILLTGVYAYSYLVEKNIMFKYFAYITLNFIVFTLIRFFIGKSELLYYIPMLVTLGIMGIELMYKKLQDKGSDIYLGISKIISFIFIYSATFNEDSKIATILAIIFAIIIIIDNTKNKDKLWNIFPLICIMPALFSNNLNSELQIGIMLLSVIATTGISLKEKQISIFTIFSGIYLFFTTFNIDSIYLKEILFICWSAINFLFIMSGKWKDAFKFLSYLSILFLYNSIILDLGLETYTLFSMLGYVIISVLTIRTVLIKHIDNIDVLEYITFGIIYLIALLQYNNEPDGMLFGLLIVIIVIASYIKKYGALFMVSIFAILVNIFVLTRKFWFSVPWWVYLLTVGTILMGFAIKNEVSEKKNEINAIELLKSIKNKIEQ